MRCQVDDQYRRDARSAVECLDGTGDLRRSGRQLPESRHLGEMGTSPEARTRCLMATGMCGLVEQRGGSVGDEEREVHALERVADARYEHISQ